MFTDQEKQIIERGKELGKTPQEVKQAIAKYRTENGFKPTPPEVAQPETGGFINSVIDKNSTSLAGRVDEFGAEKARFQSGEQGVLETGVQMTGTALAAGVLDPVKAITTSIPGVAPVMEAAGKGIGWLSNTAPIKFLGNIIGSSEKLQEAVQLYDTDPAFKQTVNSATNIITSALTTKGLVDGGTAVVQKGVDAANAIGSKTAEFAQSTTNKAVETGKSLRKSVQTTLGESSADPQLKESARRLFLECTADRIDDPVSTYDDYLNQSKKALVDIKADPAISQVGEKMGDAFKKVVEQRRAVGQVMGDELKRVGSLRTGIDDTFTTLETQLKDSGLIYDGTTGKLVADGASKLAAEDIKLLESYIKDLNSLGNSPTISQIDAHLSRTQGLVDYFKSAKGMVNTTPGERLIKLAQHSLRETLNPEVSKLPDLAKYYQARSTYAGLSDFIDDGAGYLGKVTQSGDFAKDASIAKSAVQSILNNGKKDWMLKLEELTGYKAMDDSVLALQAMKDAGDFRGLSLLETLNEGAVPASAQGITQRVIDHGLKLGKRVVAGKPEEQTRAFLQSLKTSGAVEKAVSNHLTSAEQILANTSAEKLSSMGGITKVLERTQINIVDGLKASGMVDAAKAVSQLPVGGFTTLEAFKNAVMRALPLK